MAGSTASSRPSLRSRRSGGRRMISLTPLIDVVFILLVFFMLASSFTDWRAITLDTPPAATRSGSSEGALLVRVGQDRLDLAGAPIDIEGLDTLLRERVAARPDLRVLVQPMAGVPLQRVVTVLDTAAAAGVTGLGLMRR